MTRRHTSSMNLIQRLVLITCILGVEFFAASDVRANPEYSEAYFYEFAPDSCNISLGDRLSGGCKEGAITVATSDSNSVNLHFFGDLGHWQLVISNGRSFSPVVDYVIIRSNSNKQNMDPLPDHYFSRENGDIIEGRCTPIPIIRKTSARCKIKLRDGKLIDTSFKTSNLKPMQNVQRRI